MRAGHLLHSRVRDRGGVRGDWATHVQYSPCCIPLSIYGQSLDCLVVAKKKPWKPTASLECDDTTRKTLRHRHTSDPGCCIASVNPASATFVVGSQQASRNLDCLSNPNSKHAGLDLKRSPEYVRRTASRTTLTTTTLSEIHLACARRHEHRDTDDEHATARQEPS